jgi:hypothetical protein
MSDLQRRAYARSPGAFNATKCLTCQRREGAVEARYSRDKARELGLDND